MKRLMILLLVSLFNLFSQPAFAQIDRINLGDRVRIQTPIITSDQIEGTIIDISSDHFRLTVDTSEIDIPWKEIDHLDVKRQKRNTAQGALIGGLSGGLLLSIAVGMSSSSSDEGFGPDFSGSWGIALGAAAGLLYGGAVGALIGTFVRTDQWERIPMEIALVPTPSKLDKINLNPTVSLRLSLRYKN